MVHTVDVTLSHCDSDDSETPTFFARAVALIHSGPDILWTIRSLNPFEKHTDLRFLAPPEDLWKTIAPTWNSLPFGQSPESSQPPPRDGLDLATIMGLPPFQVSKAAIILVTCHI